MLSGLSCLVSRVSCLCLSSHPDRRLANQARDDGPAVVLLDEHELPALRLRALYREDHRTPSHDIARHCIRSGPPTAWPTAASRRIVDPDPTDRGPRMKAAL